MKKAGIISLLVIILVISAVEIHFLRLGTVSITTKIIILILFNLNIIALLTLVFFVVKALTRLYLERKRQVLGSKFKTKMVVIFVILTSIPSVLMFLGASGLITTYVDRWFTPQFRQPLESTLRITSAMYDIERQQTMEAAEMFVATGRIPAGYSAFRIAELPDNAEDLVREAFRGEKGTEVVTGRHGDTVRAVLPVFSKGRKPEVVIVEYLIPGEITGDIEKIKGAYKDYVVLEALKRPLKLNYLLFLGFFTLLVIFTALWASLRIARGISEPISELAEATKTVAAGNLDVSIKTRQDDEIGLLIQSFNNMVSKLKESEVSLQAAYAESTRSELSMKNILENIQSGVISLDTEGSIITMNNAACAVLNVSKNDVVGKNYRDILFLIKSDELQEMIRGIKIKTLGIVRKDVWATINGRRTMLRISIMGLRDAASEYLGLLVVFDDLTDVIKAQKALAWQEVARRIAHEVKNPLTPIKLSTERMLKKWENRDEDFADVFERSTKTIIKEVDGLRRLVDEFSRFGKMPELQKAPTALADIIEEVANLYRDYRDLTISVEVPRQIPLVEMDGEQFRRVLINLFDNAIHAMNGKGKITVMADCNLPANRVIITVADNGPGIPEEDKEKLFLPYFSTRDGAGLGLAIASRVITEHMGYLRVKDNEPQGTVFTIEMPVREA